MCLFFLLILLLPQCRATSSPAVLDHSSCVFPEAVFNFVMYSPSTLYDRLREVHFLAALDSYSGRQKECKVVCTNGSWSGPYCRRTNDSDFSAFVHGCPLDSVPRQVVLSVKDEPITIPATLAHGTRLRARCGEVGMYKHVGATRILCRNGRWRPQKMPTCLPTTILTNFSKGSPPTIVHHVPSGVVELTREGRLVVLPGSIVHLDCLYLRTEGQPRWHWSPTFRNYPLGWAINADDRDWKYRLSIYYARANDTGKFQCITPEGTANHVRIIVRSVECPAVGGTADALLRPSTLSRRMGQLVEFSCVGGHQLVGTPAISCLANGRWSGSVPACRLVECDLLNMTDVHLLMESFNLTQGGRAVLACQTGFRLVGSRVIMCQNNGTWSAPLPVCRAVKCPEPSQPLHGYLVHSGSNRVGDTVDYLCHPNHVMQGKASSFCMTSGEWSTASPTCEPVCEFPGSPLGGSASPVLFSYRVGDLIEFQCKPGHVLMGVERIMCQGDRTWSGRLPQCRKFLLDLEPID